MSYIDRLRDFVYTAPSGKSFTLDFDTLVRTSGKKAPVSEFPTQDQGAVQDLGSITGRFPATCYISGSNYDLEADRFWAALHETGPGNLAHPRWGDIDVLPIPKEQREEFVQGARRAVFSIDFIRTNDESFEFPRIDTAVDEIIISDVEDAVEAITENVDEEITDPGVLTAAADSIEDAIGDITGAFDLITGVVDSVKETIEETANDIITDIDTLVAAPQDLMDSMLTLYRLPARVVTDISKKVDSYVTIYSDLATGFVTTTTRYGEAFGLIAAGNLNGIGIAAAESVTAGTISTRNEAVQIIEDLQDLETDIQTTIESLETGGNFAVPFAMQEPTAQAFSRAVSSLLSQALFLPSEKKLILEKDVTPIQLVWELYGDIDRLGQVLDYNNFEGEEILLISRGTEVRWYE